MHNQITNIEYNTAKNKLIWQYGHDEENHHRENTPTGDI